MATDHVFYHGPFVCRWYANPERANLMIDRLEAQIARLESENRARKAMYPVAGSLVKFVSQTSGVFTASGSNNQLLTIRIKFTADKTTGGISMTKLSPIVSVQPDFSNRYPRLTYINEPQTGDGSVVIRINIGTPYDLTTYYIKIIAMGSPTGTFTQL